MKGWLRRLAFAFAIAAGMTGCAVALLTVSSIVGRSLASRPIPGDIELTQFGVALCISLTLPWAQLQGANIIVDFFTHKASERTVARLDAIGALLLAVMTGLLGWRTAIGALSVGAAGETTMILGLPQWISYAVLAPGLGLTALIAIEQAVQRWRGTAATE